MPDLVTMVRESAQAIGLKLPEEREPAITAAVEAALQQAEAIRTSPTPVPPPSAFDASWNTKK